MEWFRSNLIEDLQPDLILWTGDSVSHDMQHMTEEDIILSIQTLTDLIKEFFPDVPLIASLGNHDFEPANYFDFSKPENDYIAAVSRIWVDSFSHSTEALTQFRQFGYYSVMHTVADSLVLIVSLNTQSCYL